MVNHIHGIPGSLELVETVMDVADIAWKAMEFRHDHLEHHDEEKHVHASDEEEEIAALRAENLRLKSVLEENLKLLQNLSDSPSLSRDCPPDLYKRLEAAVDSGTFLSQLESLHQASFQTPSNNFPFKEATGADLHTMETLVNVGLKEPSWWVWVPESGVEELSGIDNDAYVIVHEDQVVDGVSYFIARCIISNPKAKEITPQELQKTVAKALSGMNKVEKMFSIWHAGQMFYCLATWGLLLSGLYRHRAVTRIAAKGIITAGKPLMRVAATGITTSGNLLKKTL